MQPRHEATLILGKVPLLLAFFFASVQCPLTSVLAHMSSNFGEPPRNIWDDDEVAKESDAELDRTLQSFAIPKDLPFEARDLLTLLFPFSLNRARYYYPRHRNRRRLESSSGCRSERKASRTSFASQRGLASICNLESGFLCCSQVSYTCLS